jgi:hypothetical protein
MGTTMVGAKEVVWREKKVACWEKFLSWKKKKSVRGSF